MILPKLVRTANNKPCSPSDCRLFIISSLSPTAMPKNSSNEHIVQKIDFPTCCKNSIFLRRYPVRTPPNIIPIIVNIYNLNLFYILTSDKTCPNEYYFAKLELIALLSKLSVSKSLFQHAVSYAWRVMIQLFMSNNVKNRQITNTFLDIRNFICNFVSDKAVMAGTP